MCRGSFLRKKNSYYNSVGCVGLLFFVGLCASVATGVVMKALFGDRWSWWSGLFEWWQFLLVLCIVVGVVVVVYGLYFWSKAEEQEDDSGEV